MKKVAFHNLGCKVNAYEMETIEQLFMNRGYEIVPFDEKADIYVINTCSVTNIADRKSRQMLNKAKSQNPDSVVVAMGCYVQTDTEGALSEESIDILIGNNRKSKIIEIVEEYIEKRDDFKETAFCDLDRDKYVVDIASEHDYEEMSLTGLNEHTRAYIKIQDGCNQFCSYCIIPYARGRIRSREVESIVEEIRLLGQKGIKEVVLTGIHLSSYGIDFHISQGGAKSYNEAADKGEYTNRDLIEVIKRVSEIEGIERIRLGSLEPRAITRDFLKEIASVKKICPHFHLSLQSGCDDVLMRMNRHYDTELFYSKVLLLREYFEHPAITTDVIVGFPGETEEEFLISRAFLDRVDFYEVHVFKYSRRRGTVADKMKGQLTDRIKSTRSALLIEDSARREQAFKDYYKGRKVDVLFEECQIINGVSYMVGYTPEYVKVSLETSENLTNCIEKVEYT